MEISNTYNTNFTSRNRTIRHADKIAREVNTQFPTLSLSMTNRYHNRIKVQKFHKGESPSFTKDTKFMEEMTEIISSKKKNCTKFREIMKIIDKYKLANCFERSMLALVMAKCSGIKNCSIRALWGEGNNWLDHVVVYVADKKNPYVIDPWLGFADYLPKTFERYNSEYREFFPIIYSKYHRDMNFKKLPDEEFPFQSLLSDKALTPLSILKLLNERPELYVKKEKITSPST